MYVKNAAPKPNYSEFICRLVRDDGEAKLTTESLKWGPDICWIHRITEIFDGYSVSRY